MAKHLVLVGGGHAHLTCLKNLQEFLNRGHEVTLVGPASHHYYSGMGPGMLAGTYRPQEIRFNIQKMALAAGAQFSPGDGDKDHAGGKTFGSGSGGSKSRMMWSLSTPAAAFPPLTCPLPVMPRYLR